MYTAYFRLTYRHIANFKYIVHVAKVISEPYDIWNDQSLMDRIDEQLQLELNEYFSGTRKESQDCDIELEVVDYPTWEFADSLLKFDADSPGRKVQS